VAGGSLREGVRSLAKEKRSNSGCKSLGQSGPVPRSGGRPIGRGAGFWTAAMGAAGDPSSKAELRVTAADAGRKRGQPSPAGAVADESGQAASIAALPAKDAWLDSVLLALLRGQGYPLGCSRQERNRLQHRARSLRVAGHSSGAPPGNWGGQVGP
jgi:hypothetical protein